MADAVTTQILHESASDYVVKFTNVSDGTGEADVNKIDVSALTPAATGVIIDEIIFSTDGMAVRIEWDATADVPAFLVAANQTARLSFKNMGMASGIPNNGGAGVTGDVFFTTVGHTSGDTYVIILVCRKLS